ncbi:MAG: methionine--tRNA ligase subunit beta [Candidatus Micrarchaeia archaeon]
MIAIEDFRKLELRVGVVRAAERVAGTDKLLRLTVDIGSERTLVAGIATHYVPEELIGRRVIVLANLEPRTIRGITSQGMLLVADAGGQIALLTTDKDVPAGTPVR